MAHGPLVIKPHVVAKHTHVKEVIQVLAAGDKRVKGHTRKGAGVQGHQAAAHVVGARDAGARERLFHPTVELDALGPPTMADARLFRGPGGQCHQPAGLLCRGARLPRGRPWRKAAGGPAGVRSRGT